MVCKNMKFFIKSNNLSLLNKINKKNDEAIYSLSNRLLRYRSQ